MPAACCNCQPKGLYAWLCLATGLNSFILSFICSTWLRQCAKQKLKKKPKTKQRKQRTTARQCRSVLSRRTHLLPRPAAALQLKKNTLMHTLLLAHLSSALGSGNGSRQTAMLIPFGANCLPLPQRILRQDEPHARVCNCAATYCYCYCYGVFCVVLIMWHVGVAKQNWCCYHH